MEEGNHYCRVYGHHTDYGGIVHHAQYLHLLEEARTEWCEQQGGSLDRLYHEHGLSFVVRQLQAEYKAPARLHQQLVVKTVGELERNTALIVWQTVFDRDDLERPLFVARLQMVCIDKSFRIRPIPIELIGGR